MEEEKHEEPNQEDGAPAPASNNQAILDEIKIATQQMNEASDRLAAERAAQKAAEHKRMLEGKANAGEGSKKMSDREYAEAVMRGETP